MAYGQNVPSYDPLKQNKHQLNFLVHQISRHEN